MLTPSAEQRKEDQRLVFFCFFIVSLHNFWSWFWRKARCDDVTWHDFRQTMQKICDNLKILQVNANFTMFVDNAFNSAIPQSSRDCPLELLLKLPLNMVFVVRFSLSLILTLTCCGLVPLWWRFDTTINCCLLWERQNCPPHYKLPQLTEAPSSDTVLHSIPLHILLTLSLEESVLWKNCSPPIIRVHVALKAKHRSWVLA